MGLYMMFAVQVAVLSVLLFTLQVHGGCYDPSPAFPLPSLSKDSPVLESAYADITAALKDLVSKPEYDTSSFAIEITSSQETLWTSYHTAKERDENRPGSEVVDGDTAYRIASITKTFTVLAILQQHIAGNLDLDTTVDQYVSELLEPQDGSIPWKDITLRTLASQLSGIPREFAQSDFISEDPDSPDPISFGLPPMTRDGLLTCDAYENFTSSCTRKDMLDNLQKRAPLFPPKQMSTYSNVNFNLLGLVLDNVTGDYSSYVEANILKPLNMTSTSFSKLNDSMAALPKGESYYWDVWKGVSRPTGGLYATSTDLSKFLRYVLTHYNGLAPQVNWLLPQSYSTSLHSFYGLPWEIFRTDKILTHTRRPVTFVTKGGGHPGYTTVIMMVPEYDLGITILTSGSTALLSGIREVITRPLINAVENISQNILAERYTGTFSHQDLNSSLTLSHTPSKSLHLTTLISNFTDVINSLAQYFDAPISSFRLQLVPTLLFRDEENQRGEKWRILPVPAERNEGEIWDDHCSTDWDGMMYAGEPLFEVVFWGNDDGEEKGVRSVELTGFRVTLDRVKGERVRKEGEGDGEQIVLGGDEL